MQNNLVETLIGAAVIIIAAIFLIFAYNTADSQPVSGYSLKAIVNNATGVAPGTDVRIAGVKVGTVSSVILNEDFEAELVMTIKDQYREKLTEDTTLSVSMESLLGGNYVSLSPGGNFEEMLKDGDQITNSSGALDLSALIRQLVFGTGGS